MAHKNPEEAKEYNRQWYIKNRKNNLEFKEKKKEFDKEYHKDYKNPNLTPEKSREYRKKYRETHLEEVRKRDREYKKANFTDEVRIRNAKYREENAEKLREYREKYKQSGQLEWSRLKHRYGIIKEDWYGKLNEQNGLCPLCGDNFEIRKPYVDHCHTTGQFRGIIHRECNLLLGFSKDSIEILINAIDYLDKNQTEILDDQKDLVKLD